METLQRHIVTKRIPKQQMKRNHQFMADATVLPYRFFLQERIAK